MNQSESNLVATYLEKTRLLLCGFACFGIGLFVAIHGQFGRFYGGMMGVLGAVIALWLIVRMRNGISSRWREVIEMGTIGTAAMLVGWWADVDFGPILRDGVCWCSCVDINKGLGLPDIQTWMYGGMLTSALLMLPTRWSGSEIGRFASMLAGMFMGMFISEYFLARMAPENPQLHFLVTISSNALAMTGGMWLVCVPWVKGKSN